MRFGEIDIPEELLEAQENGNLVVFAGAGVSIPKPANLPDFEKLCDQIEDKFKIHREKFDVDNDGEKEEQKEPTDQYLGRVFRSKAIGFKVHQFVKDSFLKADSNPNHLHKLLLRLFKNEDNLKLITTNFDSLFTQVADEMDYNNLDNYYAPALYPGDRFNGIVYLHGSIKKKEEDLVLTDIDFSKAYLTEGWAREFLLQMFPNHSVLFYGYSVNDSIVKYLVRGLPVNTKAFIFSKANEVEKWKSLGLSPIISKKDKSKEFYPECEESLNKWIVHLESGVLEHKERIKNIIVKTHPLSSEEEEFIKYCLTKIPLTRIFCESFNHLESEQKTASLQVWLEWLDNNNFLEKLFNPEQYINSEIDIEPIIIEWICENFLKNQSNLLFSLLMKYNHRINNYLWYQICWRLSHKDYSPPEEIFNKWVSFLFSNPKHEKYLKHNVDVLLNFSIKSKFLHASILIFIFMLEPRAKLERPFSLNELEDQNQNINITQKIEYEEYLLTKTWESYFKPKLKEIWDVLLPLLLNKISYSSLIDISNGIPIEKYNSLFPLRSSIKPHEQDKFRRSADVLIDSIRDILQYLIENEPKKASVYIQQWIASNILILNRIAVDGVSILNTWEANKKIKWLLKNKLLYKYGFKHEIFHIIKKEFKNCTIDTQEKVIKTVLKGSKKKQTDESMRRTYSYEIYNLLHWISSSAPKSKIAKNNFNDYQKEFPDFTPRDYPDLDHWTGGMKRIIHSSPITAEKLVGLPIVEVVSLLLSFKKSDYFEPNREGLLNQLTIAVKDNFDWSLRLSEELVKVKEQMDDVWYNLIKGWEKGILTEEKWHKVIEFLTLNISIIPPSYAIAQLLESGVKDNSLSVNILSQALEYSDLYWAVIESKDGYECSNNDWLGTAINESPGIIMEFWIQSLHSIKTKTPKDKWLGLPENFKIRFNKIINNINPATRLSISVLASRIHYFYYAIDEVWTKDYLLPVFDWNNNNKTEQVWHGFLYWGQIPLHLIKEFKKYLIQTIDNLELKNDSIEDRLFEFCVGVLFSKTDLSFDEEWINQVYNSTNTTTKNIESMIRYIANSLRDKPNKFIESIWNNWLKEFWLKRIDNNPIALSTNEADRFIELSPTLKTVFPQVVEIIKKMNVFDLYQTHLFYDLQKNELHKKYPKKTVEMLTHVLNNNKNSSLQGYILEPIFKELQELLTVGELKPLKEQLTRLGIL